ncbi:MbtH protein [Actinoplanes lutulentus]|uniref:MbtH protein n=1 Tax=Actinoplanes lutulentus TaxID=1287878 RepID=A0A327ZIW6_9ACTN|nr:MbtH family protein [Actinoplanes lutulentus]MBB2940596.1 MbtH protein [Actinoplanes lutulentus]RAK42907.1 MbtH protein [Actinoplanes lutulentus]
MPNPFDDEDHDGSFLALVNAQNQHSLWPEPIAVPPGWAVAWGPGSKQRCLDYIEQNWTDMRPADLIDRSA